MGRRKTGADPASDWQWNTIRDLAELDEVKTGALRQSDWETDYQKPTRLLGRWLCIEMILMVGWPTFDEDNSYQGPLNRQKINKEMLVGRNKGVFKTAATAAWPAALCEVLARNLEAQLLQTASASKAQDEGESRGRKRRRIEDGTSNKEEGNDGDPDKKVVGDRRKISSEELAKVKFGEAWWWPSMCGDSSIFEGRRLNPFRMTRA